MNETLRIPPQQMVEVFRRKLLKYGFEAHKAQRCAQIFMESSLDGVYTHGVNRFPRFVEYVKERHIDIHAEPELVSSYGSMERWNGNLGPGPLNAIACTGRAMAIADSSGIGCVALSNTNHWMRGGTYGWQAAKSGYAFIGWTNTMANMPAWGAIDARLGNNPLVIAIPFQSEALVLDMAMSQFSFGTLEKFETTKGKLPMPGGYDLEGNLTHNPAEILASLRPLPAGYWKGAGLALVLDVLATILSGGQATYEISKNRSEYGLSQVFIAIQLDALSNQPAMLQIVNAVIDDYKSSAPEKESTTIVYPGERALRLRAENSQNGIPVDKYIWEQILAL